MTADPLPRDPALPHLATALDAREVAILFFGITLFMAWYATHSAKTAAPAAKAAKKPR